MTVIELVKLLIQEYPLDNFVHIRVWINEEKHFDTTLEKVQQGSDGSALLTTSIELLGVNDDNL